jgi:hypothetical protein
MCTWSAQGANRRSFDYASRDETARGSVQDDSIIFFKHNHLIYMSIQPGNSDFLGKMTVLAAFWAKPLGG